jgi:hypothetical protein
MAHMPQSKKQQILAVLKQVIPASWKWSLAVNHHSTLVLTIRSAPVDLLGEINRMAGRDAVAGGYASINEYCLDRQFDDTLPLMRRVLEAMNDGNHDRSDSQTDYFDVGWYVSIGIGRWGKPFVCTAQTVDVAAAGRAIAAECIARGLPADRLLVSVVR